MNPIDILGIHPAGALERPADPKDYALDNPEIGLAPTPFDWNSGYDVEKDLNLALPTKDQGQSGSCGGQTVSEMLQATSAVLGDSSEKSAKAYYSQVYVPGGGSNSRMLGDIAVKQGIYKESLVPSYENGNPPSEAFMERPGDINAAARADAASTKNVVAYAFPNINIDTMAAAMAANHGILIGIHGSNNGTWLSSHPSAAKQGDFWAHFMYGGKAGIENGKKGIWAKQSWGHEAAPDTNSWQFISEDHFAAGHVWDAMVFVLNQIPPKTHYTFNSDLVFGQTSEDIRQAQIAFAHEGVFNVKPTGYYGSITAQAVLKFRAKHGIPSGSDPLGHSIGPKTRAVLNSL